MDPYTAALAVALVAVCHKVYQEYNRQPRKTIVVSKDTSFARYLRSQCELLQQGFLPAFGLGHKHLQTFMTAFLPKPTCEYKREYISLPDGGEIALDWAKVQDKLSEEAPIAVILPGLTGDSNGLRPVCSRCIAEGIRPVVFHKRGHGGSRLVTPWMQSFGDTTDLEYALNVIQAKYPSSSLMGLGYSAGSALLGMYGMRLGKKAQFVVGIGVSPAYDCELLFKNNPEPLYQYIMLRGLKQLVQQHSRVLSKVVDVDEVMRSSTVAEFDERFYRRIYGYPSADAYYKDNNPVQCMGQVHFPAVLINSLDDPLCGPDRIPFDKFRNDDQFILVATEQGGHCGFIESWTGDMWSDRLAISIMKTALKFRSQQCKSS